MILDKNFAIGALSVVFFSLCSQHADQLIKEDNVGLRMLENGANFVGKIFNVRNQPGPFLGFEKEQKIMKKVDSLYWKISLLGCIVSPGVITCCSGIYAVLKYFKYLVPRIARNRNQKQNMNIFVNMGFTFLTVINITAFLIGGKVMKRN